MTRKVGDVILSDELKMRWAWGELHSERNSKWYSRKGGEAARLLDLARGGFEFEKLTAVEKSALKSFVDERMRREIPPVPDGIAFKYCEWTKPQLGSCLVIPNLGGGQNIPYTDFIVQEPRAPIDTDPRHVARNSGSRNKGYIPQEPGVAILVPNRGTVLVDGYTRSVVFWDLGKDGDTYPVWVQV
ncbi:hypothetical protein [Aestuariivirga sp.]|uniref:hypothetical protein n=1 Tax=Aestuariivirga sp. TaxID=2650926 RepID=UPI0039E3F161